MNVILSNDRFEMLKGTALSILLLLTVACLEGQNGGVGVPVVTEPSEISVVAPDPVESYSDVLKIGRPRRNKVELTIVENNGSTTDWKPDKLAIIKFFSLAENATWTIRQTLQLPSHAIGDADPQFADFNGDGLKDLTFVSETAARGANQIRTLLIYDKTLDSLVHIQNSGDYPNLRYNRKLHCIDSWMFHGATTTVFLKLENDRLREFASVDTGLELVVTATDKSGKETELRREKMRDDDIYTRYSTFDPPRP